MLQELKEKAVNKYYVAGAGVTTALAVGAPCLAFAEDGTSISSTLTTGVTSAVTEAQNAIAAVLPQALILMGVILGVTVGVRLFKRIGK